MASQPKAVVDVIIQRTSQRALMVRLRCTGVPAGKSISPFFNGVFDALNLGRLHPRRHTRLRWGIFLRASRNQQRAALAALRQAVEGQLHHLDAELGDFKWADGRKA